MAWHGPGDVGATSVKWVAGSHRPGRPDDHTCSPTCSRRQIPLYKYPLWVYLDVLGIPVDVQVVFRVLTYIFNSERTKRNQLHGIPHSIGDVIMHSEGD